MKPVLGTDTGPWFSEWVALNTSLDDLLNATRDAPETVAEITRVRSQAAAATVRAAAFSLQQAHAERRFGLFHSVPGGAIGHIERRGGAAERAVRIDRLQE